VPRPGSASSCYFIESAKTRIILDCGAGAISSLRRFADPAQLDAVLISHMHADHVLDLVALRYLCALPPTPRKSALAVFLPPGGIKQMHKLAVAVPSRDGARFFERSLRLREYDPDGLLEVGDVEISFAKTTHYVDAFAIRLARGESTIVFSADTAPDDCVAQLASDAALFICECSLGPAGSDAPRRGHSNALEAGRMAAAASAKHLLLTHYGAHEDREQLRAAAASVYGGRVTVAEDGVEFRV